MARGRGKGKRGGTKPGKLPQYLGNLQGDVGLSPEAAREIDALYKSQSGPQYFGNLLGDLNLSPSAAAYLDALAKQAAAGKTTTTAGPQFTPYTPDSIYTDTLADLAARRQRALDAATEGEKGLAGDYGLGIVQDDTGARFSGQWAASDANQGGIDPSNPFSRASLLNKSYFTANKIGEGSYANRGLLTSGAYQRSQQRNAFGFEQGRDQLIRQFASGLQGYRDRRSQAETDASTGGLAARDSLFGRNRDMYDRQINGR